MEETLYYQSQLYLILYTIKYIEKGEGRIAGIEPASSLWQREILPFDYIRIFLILDT